MATERLISDLRRAWCLPWGLLLAEVTHRVRRGAAGITRRARDTTLATYARTTPAGNLRAYTPVVDSHLVASLAPDLAERCAHYLEHRFDLLGSGWRRVRHGMVCDGFQGHRYRAEIRVEPDADGRWLAGQVSRPNLPAARAVWRLIDAAYRPIDWHVDFRSGYRWSPRTWYRRVPYGHRPGVDVKVPWELARMQHLPQMALAFGCARSGLPGFLPPTRYSDEFRHEVLDFVATNAPRYGVNWRSTMEVAIRVANWLLAYDLLRAYGARFDPAFNGVFLRSVWEHGRHIAGNLERTPAWRSNHYLADLAGLVFVAAYLPPDRDTARWWRAALRALPEEIDRQFLPDGGHFEASTSYHALATELAVYALAIIFARTRRSRNNENEPAVEGTVALFSDGLKERLGRMAEFVTDLTKPNGRIVQIGDHDSGRMFKLQPRPRIRQDDNVAVSSEVPPSLDEEHLHAGHVVAAINGLLNRTDLAEWCAGRWLDESLVAGLAGGTSWPVPGQPLASTRAERTATDLMPGYETLRRRLRATPAVESSRVVLAVADGPSLREGLGVRAYPDFGVYVFRSSRLFLCLRAGFGRHDGTGGHAHIDQLSLELSIDDVDWIRDPGSYVYSADVRSRNAYRSSRSHFMPYVLEGESSLWRNGPFDLPLDVRVREVTLKATGLAVDLVVAGNRISQVLAIGPREITVETRILEASGSGRLAARVRRGLEGRYLFGRDVMATAVPFSEGYGLRPSAGSASRTDDPQSPALHGS